MSRSGLRRFLPLIACAALSACVTPRPHPAPSPVPWDRRVVWLQHSDRWQLDGRAAVAVGSQGWQASLNWRQHGADAEVHIAGPLGVGAVTLNRTPAGLSMNGAPPGDAVLAQLQDKLGFELPLDDLRYWLLGAPNPDSPAELERNDQDRARQVAQHGWIVDYDKYVTVGDDWLPSRLVLHREGVRVRIAVDHWGGPS